MITQLEPDTLECKVKWALGSITTNKATGGDEIPVELFQILKDDAVKVLHSICQQIWKTQQWPQVWTRSVFISISEKGNPKECSNYRTIALISHTSKVMLKTRLQQYMNYELANVEDGFRKGRGTRDQIANIRSVQFSRSFMSDSLDPMNCSTPGLPVHHQLPEFTQTHVHQVGDAIHVIPFSSCPQSLPTSESYPMSQLSHEVAKVLEFQL